MTRHTKRNRLIAQRESKDPMKARYNPLHPDLNGVIKEGSIFPRGEAVFNNARSVMEEIFSEPICLFVPQAAFVFECDGRFEMKDVKRRASVMDGLFKEQCKELTDAPFQYRIHDDADGES